ncbi:MAG: hypothetical protein EHM39_14035 [Chloroflexi bacterium]|nr:MAG: hypothetical protein EHM39_14035 [Chloroflexota bacterium]
MKAIVCISDLHIGSVAGLCPPSGIQVVDGATYKPNKFQLTLWKFWRNFWGEFVPRHTAGAESVTLVINGDLIDGVHHQTTAVASNSWQKQEFAAIDVLTHIPTPVTFARRFVVRGTEAHAGQGAESEERISAAMGVEKNEIREYTTWQLWLEVSGVVFQFAHHIGVTSSVAYESSAPMREMVTGLVEAAQWGRKLPQVFVRSHRHRFILVPIPTAEGRIQSVITPGWQLRTPFTERIDRMRMPHIGGCVFRVEDGVCEVREKLYPLPDPKPIQI